MQDKIQYQAKRNQKSSTVNQLEQSNKAVKTLLHISRITLILIQGTRSEHTIPSTRCPSNGTEFEQLE